MNSVVCVAFLVVIALAATESARFRRDDKYTTKYDNVNVDEILTNERLLKNYHNCLIADTDDKCTADAKELKKSLPEAMTNDCNKCSEWQKKTAKKVTSYLLENKPDLYNSLETKFDPEKLYRKKLEASKA